MEMCAGQSVKALIEAGPIPVDRIVDVGIQVADALEAAHARGILHRELNPANVFVSPEGQVKIVDFGLPELGDALRRRPGAPGDGAAVVPRHEGRLPRSSVQSSTAGSARIVIAYIAPEQAQGQPPDERSDLYALGALLLAMLVGAHAGMRDAPPSTPRPDAVPSELETIVERLLAPAPADRYQTASSLLADLRGVKLSIAARQVERVAAESKRRRTRRTARGRGLWALALVGLAALVAIGIGLTRSTTSSRALTERDVILLAGFDNQTGQPVFDDTLAQALAVQLTQSPFLNVVAEERVRDTLRQMGREPDDRLTRDVAREACQRLGLKAMVGGSITRQGAGYRLAIDASNCVTGESLAREEGEATSQEQVLQRVGQMSSDLRTRLGESLKSVQQFDVPIAQATTTSLEALKAYTLGLAERARGRELESIPLFERALTLDPTFAAAATTLSTVYGNLGEPRRSEEYAQLAHDNRGHVSERERLFIEYQFHDRVTGNLQQAISTLEVWKQTYPSDFRPANALAISFNRLGRYERGAEEAREALRRSPGHPFALSNLAHAYRGLGRYADAKHVAEQAVALRVETVPTRRLLYQLAVLDGDADEAGAQLAWGRGKPREFDLVAAQAQVAAYQGRLAAANDQYSQTASLARAQRLPESAGAYLAHQALTLALYGERTQALAIARAALSVTQEESPGAVPRFRAVAALALLGDPEAGKLADAAAVSHPEATFVHGLLVPVTRAGLDLHRGLGASAVEHLVPALPYETGTVAVLVPLYLRGQAYLAQHEPGRAIEEFSKILAHRGTDPFSPVCALAHLGLARAWRDAGDAAKSAQAYDTFFELWRSADTTVPIFRAARQEREGERRQVER
jgi:tetratricopeptide (TPR) repeat protein